MRWTPDHDSMLFLGVNLLSREGNSQTGFRKVSYSSGCSTFNRRSVPDLDAEPLDSRLFELQVRRVIVSFPYH